MTDEFKSTPLEQVRQHILGEIKKQEEKLKTGEGFYEVKPGRVVVSAMIVGQDGRRTELIDKSEYIRQMDLKQIAEERLEAAHAEILRLNTIITYLENRNGRAEEGSVQMGSGSSVPSKDGGTSSAPETDRD